MVDITAWEGMRIQFPEGVDQQTLATRLLRLTSSSPFTAFRWKRDGLYAGDAVGCIQVGQLRLTILPKLDTSEQARDSAFLLNLLRSADYLTHAHAGAAQVRASYLDPLEVLIGEIASEMASALHEAHPRRYEPVQEDSTTIRGRIDFTQLSTRPPGRAVVPIRHSPLGVNNQLSQALKAIAVRLHRLTRNSFNRQALAVIVGQLEKVATQELTLGKLDSLVLSRHERHWTRTLAIGRLLLNAQSPDPTRTGGIAAFSLLFPMQHLFERGLRRILAKVAERLGLQTRYRSQSLFLLADPESDDDLIRLRPDYLVGCNGDHMAVADAKWRRLKEAGRAHGVSREDLYQVNAYVMRYQVKHALILQPRAPWMPPAWSKSYQIAGTDAHVHLIGVDMEALLSRDMTIRSLAFDTLSDVLAGLLPTTGL